MATNRIITIAIITVLVLPTMQPLVHLKELFLEQPGLRHVTLPKQDERQSIHSRESIVMFGTESFFLTG